MSVETPKGEKIPTGWEVGRIVDGKRRWFCTRSTETGRQQLVRTGQENEVELYLGMTSFPVMTGPLEKVLEEADRRAKAKRK